MPGGNRPAVQCEGGCVGSHDRSKKKSEACPVAYAKRRKQQKDYQRKRIANDPDFRERIRDNKRRYRASGLGYWGRERQLGVERKRYRRKNEPGFLERERETAQNNISSGRAAQACARFRRKKRIAQLKEELNG